MTSSSVAVHRRLMQQEEPEWAVWALVLLMLLAGWLAKSTLSGRTTSVERGGITLAYPAEWNTLATDETLLLNVADPFSSGTFPTRLQLRQLPVAEIGRNLTEPSDLALAWSAAHGRELDNYRALRVEPTTVAGQSAIRIDYGYVAPATFGSAAATLPVVARAQDLLLQRGDQLTIITFAAEAPRYEEAYNIWEDVLPSLAVQ